MFFAFVLLAFCYFETTTSLAVSVFLIAAKLFAYMRRHKLEFVYDKTNKLFNEFISKTEISTLEYETFLLAPYPLFQALCYLVKEVIYENFYPDPFKREFITCPDGGTIGLDWDGEIPDHTKPLTQPLLVIAPGLGGGTHNLYTISMLQKVRS